MYISVAQTCSLWERSFIGLSQVELFIMPMITYVVFLGYPEMHLPQIFTPSVDEVHCIQN